MTRSFWLASLIALSATAALAQDATEPDRAAVLQALDEAIPGTFLHDPLSLEWVNQGDDVRTKVVAAPELNTGQALSIRNKTRHTNPWDAAVNIPITEPVASGDRVQVYYWLRTSKPPKGSDTASVNVFLGRNEEPYDNIVATTLQPGSEWELKSVTGTAGADFPAGKLKLEFQIGSAKQTVELGPVYVSRLN